MQACASDGIETAVMRVLCKRIKTGYARRVAESLSDGNNYVGLDITPHAYTDPHDFGPDYLLYSFLRKWKGWKLNVDPEAAAFSSWMTAEQKCRRTNTFLDQNAHPYGTLAFIEKVQRKIEHVIGKWPPDDIFSRCRWSSGATMNLRRDESDVLIKTSRTITVTRPALKHLVATMDSRWLEALPPVPYRIVSENRMVMVPKNAKTHRSIAAEPTGNAFLQQGVGRFIRAKLLAFGVNLNDQTINQDAAFRARVDDLSTLDLSSASDTLCMATVRLFLPPAWFDLLCDLRSPRTTFKGKTYFLNKFSSMGNAYTFELESLIFWALAKTCCEAIGSRGTCTVFGDDIIVPRPAANLTTLALEYFGFQVNQEKSYYDGPFYESCGKQYHELEDVTPAFQKEVVGTQLFELIRLHNRLYRWGLRSQKPHIVKDACNLVLKFTHEKHPRLKSVPMIPEYHPGDLGFLSRSCKPRRDGDYDCTVLAEVPIVVHAIQKREIMGAFAYKLRKPDYTSMLPDGSVGVDAGVQSVLRKQRIWASSLLS